jgi:hypothetical protein
MKKIMAKKWSKAQGVTSVYIAQLMLQSKKLKNVSLSIEVLYYQSEIIRNVMKTQTCKNNNNDKAFGDL